MREFRYLEYMVQRNGGEEKHVKEKVGKAAAVMAGMAVMGNRKKEIWKGLEEKAKTI